MCLRKAIPLKCNLEPAELRGLWDLCVDDTVVIIVTDKGSAMGVMDAQDYHRKTKELLDPITYKQKDQNVD